MEWFRHYPQQNVQDINIKSEEPLEILKPTVRAAPSFSPRTLVLCSYLSSEHKAGLPSHTCVDLQLQFLSTPGLLRAASYTAQGNRVAVPDLVLAPAGVVEHTCNIFSPFFESSGSHMNVIVPPSPPPRPRLYSANSCDDPMHSPNRLYSGFHSTTAK
jgi:hypothetical protein